MARVSSASNSARLSAAGSAEVGAWGDYASPSAISIEDEEEDDELGT